MPLYEYRCESCGQEFEKMVPLSAINARQECPSCQSRETYKKLSTFATRGASGGGTGGMSSCGTGGGGRFT